MKIGPGQTEKEMKSVVKVGKELTKGKGVLQGWRALGQGLRAGMEVGQGQREETEAGQRLKKETEVSQGQK